MVPSGTPLTCMGTAETLELNLGGKTCGHLGRQAEKVPITFELSLGPAEMARCVLLYPWRST